MSYGLGYQPTGTSGGKPAPTGRTTQQKPTRTDSSSMRWSGLQPGEPWRPSWSRSGTPTPTPTPPTSPYAPGVPSPYAPTVPAPTATESEFPWGVVVAGLALVLVGGTVYAVSRRRPRRPRPNRRGRRRRRNR